MAERLAYLEAVIGADVTQFRKAMRDVRNDVGVLSETIGGIGKLGRTLTFAVSAPLATLGSYTVQAASSFDGAMRNINSIANMSEEQLASLSAEVREFGATTRGGAVESANALYTVFSAGLTDTALAMSTMQVATKTAEAGLADMETTTEALVASMLSYGTANMTAERASDALTAMVQVGVGSMQNFANAVANALPQAANLGIEIEDLYGAMAFMTQRGFSASKASTSLNSAMTALVKPTEAMAAAMSTLGVKGAEELISKYGTLGEAVKALIGTTDGTSESIAKLFSNIRGKRFVDLVASDMDAFDASMKEFDKIVKGATNRAHEEQMKSFAAQWDLMTSAVEGASIAIGQVLLPVITPLIQGVADIFNGLSKLNPEIIQVGVGVAGVVTVGAPLLWLLSSLLNPIGLVGAGMAALGVDFVQSAGGISEAFDQMLTAVPALAEIKRAIEDAIPSDPITTPDIVDFAGVTVDPSSLVKFETVEAGDTVWDWWLERSDQSITWEEFKTEFIKQNGTLDLVVGDLVKIPTTNVSEAVAASTVLSSSDIQNMIAPAKLQADKMVTVDGDGRTVQNTLARRLETAFEKIEPQIMPALTGIMNKAKAFFDTKVGEGLTWLARMFESSTGTTNTDALSTAIGNAFQFDADKTFPNLSAGLTLLIEKAGAWLMTDALPLISKGVGRFIGEIGILIGKGFGAIGDWISGGGVGDATEGLSEAVVNPFLEGFNDATDGAGIESGIDSLLTGIAGAIGAYAVANFLIFGGVASSITTAIGSAFSVVKIAAGFGASLIAKIGTALAATATGQAVGSGFALLADRLKFKLWFAANSALIGVKSTALYQGAALYASSIIQSVTSTIGSVWSTATSAGGTIWKVISSPITAGITIGTLTYFSLSEEAKQQLYGYWESILDTIFGEGATDRFVRNFENTVYNTMAGIAEVAGDSQTAAALRGLTGADVVDISAMEVTFSDPDVSQGTLEMFKSLKGTAQQQLMDWFAAEPMTVDEQEVRILTWAFTEQDQSPEDIALWFNRFRADYFDDPTIVVTPAMVIDWMNVPEPAPTALPEFDDYLPIPKATMAGKDAGVAMATGVIDGAAETNVDGTTTAANIIPQAEIVSYAEETGGAAVGALATGVSEAFLSGEFTAETFKEEFLIPFVSNWVSAFGSEGSMSVAFSAFAANIGMGMGSISFGLMTATLVTVTQTGIMANAVETASKRIGIALTKARGEIAEFLDAMRSLAGAGADMHVKVEVTGSVQADDPNGLPNHETGLDFVPYDGYTAQLHKGEMVVPANVAKDLRKSASMASSMAGNTPNVTTNNNSSNNEIYISGVQDVDGLLNELRRRGIYLT